MQTNFVQTLSTFFNQNPADKSTFMYKVLILTLQTNCLSSENKKTLLSEIKEVMPCIIRIEKELFPALFTSDGKVKEIENLTN